MCISMKPVYASEKYVPVESTQIRRLKENEVNNYLKEQREIESK